MWSTCSAASGSSVLSSFAQQAQDIIKEKGYDQDLYLARLLLESVEDNLRNILLKIEIYKWAGLLLLTSIPILSAFLSMAVTTKIHWLGEWPVPVTSLLLTFLTILNSIFKFRTRFQRVCELSIQTQHFIFDLLEKLKKIKENDEPALLQMLKEERNAFEKCQKELISLFMPDSEIIDRSRGRG